MEVKELGLGARLRLNPALNRENVVNLARQAYQASSRFMPVFEGPGREYVVPYMAAHLLCGKENADMAYERAKRWDNRDHPHITAQMMPYYLITYALLGEEKTEHAYRWYQYPHLPDRGIKEAAARQLCEAIIGEEATSNTAAHASNNATSVWCSTPRHLIQAYLLSFGLFGQEKTIEAEHSATRFNLAYGTEIAKKLQASYMLAHALLGFDGAEEARKASEDNLFNVTYSHWSDYQYETQSLLLLAFSLVIAKERMLITA